MAKQFTTIAFTEGVKKAQTDYGSREIYQNFEQRGISEDLLSAREIEFIGARDSIWEFSIAITILIFNFAVVQLGFRRFSMKQPWVLWILLV